MEIHYGHYIDYHMGIKGYKYTVGLSTVHKQFTNFNISLDYRNSHLFPSCNCRVKNKYPLYLQGCMKSGQPWKYIMDSTSITMLELRDRDIWWFLPMLYDLPISLYYRNSHLFPTVSCSVKMNVPLYFQGSINPWQPLKYIMDSVSITLLESRDIDIFSGFVHGAKIIY